MADKGYLPKEKIKEFVEALGKDAAVYAPSLEGDTIIFRQYTPDKEISLERPANTPPKGVIYPQCETLLSFEFKKDQATPQKMDIELKTNLDFPKAVVFGGRPCDARGFTVIDRVFINAEASDPYYQKRRENTTIITKCCNRSLRRLLLRSRWRRPGLQGRVRRRDDRGGRRILHRSRD